jgi:tripartite-type tricarboxylate transporter receptor subunit TctC
MSPTMRKCVRFVQSAKSSIKCEQDRGRSASRRRFVKQAVSSIAICGVLALLPTGARATEESYPLRTVTIIVPWTPGSSPDGIARIAAAKLKNRLGQPFVVENRPGAGSIIGIASAAKAAPDGYTLLLATTSMVINASLRKTLPFDTEKDFVPLALVGHIPYVLVVNPSLPVHSVSDLIALAKRKPGELSYGSGGLGHPAHILAEMLKRRAGIEMAHVPYKGSPPALNDLVGGHIHLMFADILPSLPLIADGQVRGLAVSSRTRASSAPQLPPMAEAGLPDFEVVGWFMFMAPARTPPQVVDRIRAELVPLLVEADVESWIVNTGMIPAQFQGKDELQRHLVSEVARWREVLTQLGLAGSQ